MRDGIKLILVVGHVSLEGKMLNLDFIVKRFSSDVSLPRLRMKVYSALCIFGKAL